MKNNVAYQKSLSRIFEAQKPKSGGFTSLNKLLDSFGRPQDKLKIFHVAGSNGKGSVCAILAALLAQQGYRVGVFTSPHLVSACERIVVDGFAISQDKFAQLENRVQGAVCDLDLTLSFFERLTAMAFVAFKEAQLDFVMLEAGLGGRLDATNICRPLISILTPISTDHVEILGGDLEKIALEKAGIIKHKIPVVSTMQTLEVEKVFFRISEQNESQVSFLESKYENFFEENCALAALAVTKVGLSIPGSGPILRIPGRYDWVSGKPRILVDGAHNPAALGALLDRYKKDNTKKPSSPVLLFGASEGHQLGECFNIIAQKLGVEIALVLTSAGQPKSIFVAELRQSALEAGFQNVSSSLDFAEGLAKAKWLAGKGPSDVIICGSMYLAGAILGELS